MRPELTDVENKLAIPEHLQILGWSTNGSRRSASGTGLDTDIASVASWTKVHVHLRMQDAK